MIPSWHPIASKEPSGENDKAFMPSSLTLWWDSNVELPPEPFESPGGSRWPIYNMPFSVPVATLPGDRFNEI